MTQAILIPPKNQASRIRTPQRGARAIQVSMIEMLVRRRQALWIDHEQTEGAINELHGKSSKEAQARIYRLERQKACFEDENYSIENLLLNSQPSNMSEAVHILETVKTHIEFVASDDNSEGRHSLSEKVIRAIDNAIFALGASPAAAIAA